MIPRCLIGKKLLRLFLIRLQKSIKISDLIDYIFEIYVIIIVLGAE